MNDLIELIDRYKIGLHWSTTHDGKTNPRSVSANIHATHVCPELNCPFIVHTTRLATLQEAVVEVIRLYELEVEKCRK